jgi:hypothetical protein
LTNVSENNVLDTILSRVIVFNLASLVGGGMSEGQGGAFPSMENWDEIISYFFKNKLEKEEYLAFLENLVKYARQNFCFIEFLDELENDIN